MNGTGETRDTHRNRSRAILSIALLLTLAAGLAGLSDGLFSPIRSIAHADPAGIKYSGVQSCGGTGCHGEDNNAKKSSADPDISHDEKTIWERYDMHSRASSDTVTRNKAKSKGLGNDKSKLIAQKLNIPDAAADKRCIICHSLSGFSNGTTKSRILLDASAIVAEDVQKGRYKASFGVSCDACHGPSEKYITPHQTKGWTQAQRVGNTPDALFNNMGLYDTRNLKLRANLCVSCHLKIDADLVAAGHPEPAFELDSYCHGNWMHWRPKSNFDGAKVWSMGQFACLREAALQLAERIEGGAKVDRKLVRNSYEKLAAHLLMARHPAMLVAPELVPGLDEQFSLVNSNWADPAAASKALKSLGDMADKLADKMNAKPLDKALAETLANDVAAEGVVAGSKDFRAAFQYTYAMTSLWEVNFLLGSPADMDRIALDKKIKDTPKSKKILVLYDEIDDADKYNAANFVKAAQEVMALFPGGKALPLPGKEPDEIAKMGPQIAGAPTPPTPAIETKPVAVVEPKPVTPPVEVKKPVTPPADPKPAPAVVEVKPVTPPPADPKPAPVVAEVKPATPPAVPEKKTEPEKTPAAGTATYTVGPSAPLEPGLLGKVIYCPRCAQKNQLESTFCIRCGLKLPKLSE